MKSEIKLLVLTCWILTATVSPLLSADTLRFSFVEIPEFHYEDKEGSELLEMSYASHVIRNPEVWSNKDRKKKLYRVDIIYTRYPFHKQDWIIPYDTLLNRRMRAICNLEPGLTVSQVTWNLVLQTECRTEEDAKHLFHGAVLWYKEEVALEKESVNRNCEEEIRKPSKVRPSSNIQELMSGSYDFPDSTVFNILERNSQWSNMLIVTDWTSSMYQYGAQAVLWNESQWEKQLVSRFVFFNDGDSRKVKPVGKTGGIYFTGPDNVQEVIKVMEKVQKNGTGGDTPENDIEALLKATRKTKTYGEVLLIADNNSPVKDMKLLQELKVPVRVIVCGCRKGQTIRHDYLQIASVTHGSIHTIEEDIWNLSEIKEGERVTILDIPYQRTHGRIVKSRLKAMKAQL